MNTMKNVISKELSRVFKDKKMIFSIFILPVVLIAGMMYLMTSMMSNVSKDVSEHMPVVYIQNAPQSFQSFVKQIGDIKDGEIIYINDNEDTDAVKDSILNESTDLLVVFPKNFEQALSNTQMPDIKTYYNPSVDYSSKAKNVYVNGYLEGYRQSLLMQKYGSLDEVTLFSVDRTNEDGGIIQDDSKATGKVLGMLIPYFVTIMLFAGAMNLGIDTIAGEKERGTLASLLLTPAKRSSIVMGKLVSLMVLSVLSAAMYVVGMLVSVPMISSAGDGIFDLSGLSLSFTPMQILQLIVVMIGLVFLYVSLVSVVAVFAKTVKEASTYIMPLYIIVIIAGILTMYGNPENTTIMYAIPMYNSSMALKSILTGDITLVQFMLTAVSTFVAAGVVTAVIAKAFNSEKVMFNA